jgi:hypothetical protein
MANRIRLTSRSKKAVDGSIPYPGNVNQPDRKFKEVDQYDNFVPSLNHPIPDMRTDWRDEKRDEIGFGIHDNWGTKPTVASIRVAANKAVKLSYLLLGEKVEEEVIEAQANDFMSLGPEALDRSLSRFAETQKLYAEEEEAEEDTKEASAELADNAAEDTGNVEDTGASEKEAAKKVKAEETKEEETKEASEEEVEEEETKEASEADEEETKEASEEDDEEDDTKEASEDDEEETKESSKKASRLANMDIELTSSMDDGMPEGETDARLAGLFDDDNLAELTATATGQRKASAKKQGIKSLGGQPRVAKSNSGSTDISSIWTDVPDVSEIFR